MVYSNKFVACILLNGKPVKELSNGTVILPFETEYSLRFRNKNNRRAVVKIFIDGEEVSGGGYIIDANSHVDIHRHHDVDRAFKFVCLESPDAVDFGKNGPNDDKVKGTIEARFYLEKEQPVHFPIKPLIREVHHHHYRRSRRITPPWGQPQVTWSNTSKGAPLGPDIYMGGGGTTTSGPQMPNQPPLNATYNSTADTWPALSNPLVSNDANEGATMDYFCFADQDREISESQTTSSSTLNLKDGCTVEGNSTGQRFTTVHIDLETDFVSVKIFLQGHETKKKKQPKVEVVTATQDEIALQQENERLLNELNRLKKEQEAEAAKKKRLQQLEAEKARLEAEIMKLHSAGNSHE